MKQSDIKMLDIIMPVYNEGSEILKVLKTLKDHVRSDYQIFICYDYEEDPTLSSIRSAKLVDMPIAFVKNEGVGVHAAILSGFKKSTAKYVLVFPADDLENAKILDAMVAKAEKGNAIVVASRFIEGGCMVNCRWTKAALVRTVAWTLYNIARVPVHDPTNGFRLFSRRVLENIEIESSEGFTYSLELLVKAHRLGLTVAEVPSKWFERKVGNSRFKILKWAVPYGRWYVYAFATTFLGLKKRALKTTDPSLL